MKHIILIFAALALIPSCARNFKPNIKKEAPLIISSKELQKGLEDHMGPLLYLSDTRYRTVSLPEINWASWKTWMRWVPEKWDCDDQAVELVSHLRKSYALNQTIAYPPACGTVGCIYEGEKHRLVWFVDHTGSVEFYDASRQRRADKIWVSNFYWALDK